MKIIKLFLILIAFISFTSCDDDDDDGTFSSNDLEGTWQLIFSEYEGTVKVMDEDSVIVETIQGKGRDFDFQTTYNDDGTFESSGTYVIDETTSIDNETTMETIEAGSEGSSGEYTFDGTIITLSNSFGVESEFTVTTLTSNSLILQDITTSKDTLGSTIIDTNGEFEVRYER